ncbi:MAG: GntR family transcriptional regulator [Deltaproteobacteria bacterium]|nr:GntR family transcriptional regulator [Deltaproteobacteria bacterium]
MNNTISSSTQLLRTQVYEYLREQLKTGKLRPGMFVSINKMVENLGLSRTPLRDALLQLQVEGFVTFLPQRGIKINELNLKEIENIYEVMGALDSRVLISVFHGIGQREVDRMGKINEQMLLAAEKKDFYRYWELNSKFHGVYLNLSRNNLILYHLNILRQRLFGFGEIDWGNRLIEMNYQEHVKIIALITQGNAKKAANYIRDVHVHLPSHLIPGKDTS